VKCKKGCSRCCEYLRIELQQPWPEDYCEARGLGLVDGYFQTIEIPHRCPKLLENGKCKLGDERPQVCKEFYCDEKI